MKLEFSEKSLCPLAIELATMACGDRIPVMVDGEYTMISVPTEVMNEISKKANPNPEALSLEQKIKILKEIKWSRDWAEGMCRLVYGDEWDTMPNAEREQCVDRMLSILARKVFE